MTSRIFLHLFARCLPFAAVLPALVGCAAPPPQPAAPQADAARQIMDMQIAARPTGNEPAMSGDEASIIYSRYLANIGRSRGNGRSGQDSGSQSGASTPMSSANQ